MKKIPSAFLRDEADMSKLTRTPHPSCGWLFAPSAIETVRATRKWDGTSCMVRDGALYARYDAKHGKTPPPGFWPAQDPDPVTGHWPGWILVVEQPHLKWHREAWERWAPLADGTYELCGPKISANPDGFSEHVFMPHGEEARPMFVVTYDSCELALREQPWEGIVFHGPDGQMAKIKRRDFGLPWAEKRKE
jgi:hypothetical protein